MSDRNSAMNCCERYGIPFAAWDLRLYLDTHPADTQAMEKFAQLCGMCGDSYASAGIRPCDYADGIWHWLDGPWPWEPEANCRPDHSACASAEICARGGR